MTIIPADLDRLEALARAATPGPWAVEDPMGPDILSVVANGDEPVYNWLHVAQVGIDDPTDGEPDIAPATARANAAFIAAANPSTVLRLIAGCRRKM